MFFDELIAFFASGNDINELALNVFILMIEI